MAVRVTAVAVDVLRFGNPKARATAVAVDVLRAQGPSEEVIVTAAGLSVAHDETGPLDLVMTQHGVEAIAGGADTPQLTQHGVEVLAGGSDTPLITQHGVEVLYRVFPGCEQQPIAYRVRIRNAADDDDQVVFDSLAEGTHAVVIEPPVIDASRIDPITGKTDTGACSVQIADPTLDDCAAEPDGTVRVFTQEMADDTGRLQLLGRRVLVEVSIDEGDTWASYWGGFLAGIRFPDAITVELSLATSTREDETRKVWTGYSETFPNGACLLGGPVILGVPSAWPSVRVANNEGHWKGTVIGVYPTHIDLDIDEDASGAFPPSDIRPFLKDRGFLIANNDDFQRNVFKWAERNAQPFFVRSEQFIAEQIFGWYPRVDVDIVIKNDVPFDARFPMVAARQRLQNVGDTKPTYATLFNGNLGNGFGIAWPDDADIPQPVEGDTLRFYARPKDTSDAAPLWVTGHPVDILLDLWDECGIPHTSGGSVKTALGTNEVALRITKPMTLSEAQTMLCGAFGFGWRVNANGTRSLFTTRVRPAVAATITDSDLVSDAGVVWEVDEKSKLFAVAYKWQRFERWPALEDASSAARALDGVIAYDEHPVIFQSQDVEPYGSRTQEYVVPGHVLTGDGQIPDTADVTAVLAAPRLASFADGMITTTIDVRSTVLVLEGDDVLLELSHRPGTDGAETPTAQRGLVERCQCIARVPREWGSTLTLVRVADAGDPLSNDPATEPDTALGVTATVTGAPATATPSTHVTLTNASNVGYLSSYRIEVAYAVQAAEPLDDGVLWPSEWDAFSDLTFDLGPFAPQSVVWFRTRLVDVDTGQVDDWSLWDSVTLDPLTGQTGDATGLQTPTVVLAIAAGVISATVEGGPAAVKAYCAASKVSMPSAATVLAGASTTVLPFSFAALVTLADNETAFVAVITEDVDGNQSLRGVAYLSKPAGGGGGGGGGGGLYDLTAGVPAAAGFTTVNLSAGTTLNESAGKALWLQGTTHGGGIQLAAKAVPGATPYRVVMLMENAIPGNDSWVPCGWRDSSTGALQLTLFNQGAIVVQSYSGPSSFASQQYSETWQAGHTYFLGFRDDGTDVFFEISKDGVNFITLYSVAKSAGYLGSAGYNQIFFGVRENNFANYCVTCRLWDEGGIARVFP